MSLLAGARLGPYEIVTFIGAGGMGEVYKARDTRLNRIVAIKILPSHNRADSDRRRRFEREAQAVAALAHPHICVLHDIGRHEDCDFLVMEYLEGETLASRLRQGPLPVDQVLRYAAEIGDALDKAHRQGIVHRDLTPGNIMLTEGGVKLLDFGLAKLRPAAATSAIETSPADALTAPGSLLGTLPYMAPEQLEGASGDERTDIFAFGAVLYEMASGRRAFRGDSQASLVAAILHRDPEPLASVQPTVPPGLDRLVVKCLAKDPDARWQSASDVADELRWIAGGGGSRAGAVKVSLQRRRVRWAATAIAVLLVVAAGAAIWRWRGAVRPGAPEVKHQQVTFSGDVEMSALSPDGRTVAYVPRGFDRVLVRELSGGQASPVWTGNVMAVSWLPDGSHLVVIGGNRIVWIVPRLGGTARRVADSARMAAPSPDGTALALTADGLVGFYTLSLAGGETRVVTLTGFSRVIAIDWHARANRVVLTTSEDDEKVFTLWSVASDGRDKSRLLTGTEFIRAICTSSVSDVVYVMRDHDGSLDLLRVPVYADPGAVRVLLTGLPATMMGYRCTVSADGRRLLYGRSDRLSSLWRLNLARLTTQPTRLTRGPLDFWTPAVSKDGLWVAATARARSEFTTQVVKIPTGGGEPVRLGEGGGPVWSPDGQQLAFTSRRSGSPRVWISGANGQWPKEVKDSAVGGPRPTWLPDGRLAWQTPDRQNYRIRDLWTGRDEDLFTDAPIGEWVSDLTFSPRGDQLVLNRYGPVLWLLSWPGRQERWRMRSVRPISWSADGEWIYAIEPDGSAVVRVSSRTGATEPIGQIPVGLRINSCDLTPDRDVMVCSLIEEKLDAWVMENFDPGIS